MQVGISTKHPCPLHNYRFHNPNTAEVTADYLLKILIEANASKVEQAIQEAANELPEQMNGTEGHST